MNRQIKESEFIDTLKSGVRRTASFMTQLTDYHGAPTKTEYILSADLARAFLDKHYEVVVECLNRRLVNGMTKRAGWNSKEILGSKRTDVAV